MINTITLFQLEQGCAIQPYQAPGRLTYPVVFRAHTYFMSSLENRQKFMDNPLHYLKLSNPPPVVPVKLAIVGPPKSGKTMRKSVKFLLVPLGAEAGRNVAVKFARVTY